MTLNYRTPDDFLAYVAKRGPNQSEFLQAVKEVAHSLWPFLQQNHAIRVAGTSGRAGAGHPVPRRLGR